MFRKPTYLQTGLYQMYMVLNTYMQKEMEAEHIAQASRVAEREREGKKDWAKLTLSVEMYQLKNLELRSEIGEKTNPARQPYI